MTEFRVDCFHINFFPKQMRETYFSLKVLNIVQVVNDYINYTVQNDSKFLWG